MDSQDYYNFNLNVPSSAIIKGIEVFIEGSNGENASLKVKLSWNGGSNTVEKSENIPIVENTVTYGNSTDKWGREWSVSDFSNTNFLLVIDGLAGGYPHNFYVDHIQVKIHYAETLKAIDKKNIAVTNITDSISTVAIKKLISSISIIDSVVNSLITYLAVVITFIDSFALGSIKKQLDSILFIDNLSSESDINKTQTDILSISEQLAKSTSISKSDAYALVDALSSFIYIGQSNDDTVNVIETLLLNTSLSKTDILELLESYSRTSEHERILSDIASINENLSIETYYLNSDIFNFVEHVIQTREIITSDIFDIAESVKIDASKKLFAIVLFAEQLQLKTDLTKEDAFAIIDVLFSTSTFYKEIIESIDIIESISKENSLNKTEIITLVDAFSKVSGYVKTFIENPIFSETLQKDIILRPVDSLNFVDFVKFASLCHLSDATNLTDLIFSLTSLSTTDTLNIADAFNCQFAKQSSDSIELLDTQARLFAANRVFTESVIVDESLSSSEQYLLADMLTIQEIINTSCNISKSDTLVIIGEVSKTDTGKNISDVFVVLEDLTKSVNLYIIDTEETIDLFSKLSTFNLSQDDIVVITDNIKVDRRTRIRRSKTTLVSSDDHNKVYLFHKMRN